MSDELIRRLRDDATFWDAGNDIDSSEPLRKAADLIEQQAARIAALESAEKEAVPMAWMLKWPGGISEVFIEERTAVDAGAIYRTKPVPLYAAPAPASKDAIRREALEADADRYRWLREQHWNEADVFVIAGSKSQVHLGTDCPRLDRLDAAIDAALSQKVGDHK